MNEIILETIKWTAPEYTHREHDNDWFWTIGAITVVACGLAIWFGSYVFAIFLFVSGFCLIMFTARPPQNLDFAIETRGLTIGKDFHEWKSIKSFNIKEPEKEEYAKLIIETGKHFLPIYTLPLPKDLIPTVRTELKKIVTSSEIDESRTMLFAERLGF